MRSLSVVSLVWYAVGYVSIRKKILMANEMFSRNRKCRQLTQRFTPYRMFGSHWKVESTYIRVDQNLAFITCREKKRKGIFIDTLLENSFGLSTLNARVEFWYYAKPRGRKKRRERNRSVSRIWNREWQMTERERERDRERAREITGTESDWLIVGKMVKTSDAAVRGNL
jgi:hypothetical protein